MAVSPAVGRAAASRTASCHAVRPASGSRPVVSRPWARAAASVARWSRPNGSRAPGRSGYDGGWPGCGGTGRGRGSGGRNRSASAAPAATAGAAEAAGRSRAECSAFLRPSSSRSSRSPLPRISSRTNGSLSSSLAVWKQSAATCLQGRPWSGHEQLGSRSPAAGSSRVSASWAVSARECGISLASSADRCPGRAATASRRASHPVSVKVRRRSSARYGRGRLPWT